MQGCLSEFILSADHLNAIPQIEVLLRQLSKIPDIQFCYYHSNTLTVCC